MKDYDDATFKVRCDGVPKPEVHWFRDGKEIVNDKRHTITTEVGGQVDSELAIKNFNASDAGKVIRISTDYINLYTSLEKNFK